MQLLESSHLVPLWQSSNYTVDGHLVYSKFCCSVLANIVYMSFCVHFQDCLYGVYLRGIASYRIWAVPALQNYSKLFSKENDILFSHQQMRELLSFLYHFKHIVLSVKFLVEICISLITKKVKHVFKLWVIQVSWMSFALNFFFPSLLSITLFHWSYLWHNYTFCKCLYPVCRLPLYFFLCTLLILSFDV